MLPPNGRKRIGTKGPLNEEESEGADLKLLKKKNEDHGIQSHYCMANRGGKGGSSVRFPLLAL